MMMIVINGVTRKPNNNDEKEDNLQQLLPGPAKGIQHQKERQYVTAQTPQSYDIILMCNLH